MFRALKGATLATRLAAGLFLPMALALAAALVAWSGFDHARSEIDQAQRRALPALKAIYAVQAELQANRLLEAQWLAAHSDDQREALATLWNAQSTRLQQRLQTHEALDPVEAQRVELLAQAVHTMLLAQRQVLGSGVALAQRDHALAVAEQAEQATQHAFESWRSRAEQSIDEQAGLSAQDLSVRDVATASLVIAAVALALLSWQQLARSLQTPLQQSSAALQALSKGHIDFKLSAQGAPEIIRLMGQIDALREVIAFACDTEGEDDLMDNADRLAISARAFDQYQARLTEVPRAPQLASTALIASLPQVNALPAVARNRPQLAANDAMAQPA